MKNPQQFFKWDDLAIQVWETKYALRDDDGNLIEKSPEETIQRLAKEFARIEKKYGGKNKLDEAEIINLIGSFNRIIPHGSPIAGIGNPKAVSLANCYVLPPTEDSINGIGFTDISLANVFKRRGGAGVDISYLRPKSAKVNNSALTTTGTISFLNQYSETAKRIGSEGRRAALLIILDILHPDIMEFIKIKRDLQKVTGANISIKFRNEFFEKLLNKNEKYWITQFPINNRLNDKQQKDIIDLIEKNELKINELYEYQINENEFIYIKVYNINEVWNEFVKSNWLVGDPGIVYWDKIRKYNPAESYPEYASVGLNPCAELSMGKYNACMLMSINLSYYVKNPFAINSYFDYSLFASDVRKAQRLMDDLIDLEIEKIEKIIKKIKSDPESEYLKQWELILWKNILKYHKRGRRTGLGITGLGDMLAKLLIKYDSDEALEVIENVFKTKMLNEWRESVNLARERSKFKDFKWKLEKDNEFIKFIKNNDEQLYYDIKKYGRRNISISTIAPTGSISILAGVTSGIEPLFAPYYKRRRKVNENDNYDFVDDNGYYWKEYFVLHRGLIEWYSIENKIDYLKAKEILENMKENELEKIFNKSPYYGSTAHEIKPKRRVEIQGLIQKYVSHSISSTVNFPQTASEKEMGDVYIYAWQNGLKGITTFREGSRLGVLETINKDKKSEENKKIDMNKLNDILKQADFHIINENNAPKRPKELPAHVFIFKVKGEKWIAFVGIYNNHPYEIFSGKLDAILKENPEFSENIKVGKIIKKKELKQINILGEKKRISQYNFVFEKNGKEYTINEINKIFDREYWNLGKLISMLLRHNAPIKYLINVIDSLKFDGADISSWKKGIVKVLKKYTEIENNSLTCPICGENSLIYENGCLTCKSCGWSKCE